MSIYVISVNGLLHHATRRLDEHQEYAAKLRQSGHDVTTEEREASA